MWFGTRGSYPVMHKNGACQGTRVGGSNPLCATIPAKVENGNLELDTDWRASLQMRELRAGPRQCGGKILLLFLFSHGFTVGYPISRLRRFRSRGRLRSH